MADWVIVVDDNLTNLKMAGHALSKNGMRVTALRSGQALLDYVSANGAPDLILLDIIMPQMDGFQTLVRLRELEQGRPQTPVIFLTADETEEAEMRGLSLGAMDFIRKPFLPDVLALRVRHIIDLSHLQEDLSQEVEKKTRENEELFFDVVSALAASIDAKDTYTNGHSSRVADYARQIAHRYGYSPQREKEVYMMGLLHDVGKIGIPDAIINKPARLSDDEYAIIKTHTVMGARILSNIKKMPSLVYGARWHHERYDGKGYPDCLVGKEIPEEARIIAVADAYDAMTSRRSYRDARPQDFVRRELQNGKGSQFDPVFADIMLAMMDEDTDFNMREK
ncbi:MAG: response regulator [Coriobacteriales bacterium]|nr:response regulator [Coriobacteriales bacterium]